MVVISMGSVVGTIKELIDQLEEEGKKVGLLQICSYRPFPRHEVYRALEDKMNIVVLEKAHFLGKRRYPGERCSLVFSQAEK